MNRGSFAARCDPPSCSGFNEAPIHESGKDTMPIVCFDRGEGFNEAPIHESGKETS